ncbi:MAG TPA: HAMP domain-containing sensor histidine kinase [Candidatus Acidoferrum sp.]|nr:HAMP domain-containing sensor histidine kinase [Candidatus Acidoferrum sp.]
MSPQPAIGNPVASDPGRDRTLPAAVPEPVRVLAFGEDPANAPLLEQLLRPCQQEFRIKHARLRAGSLEKLAEIPSDIALVHVPLSKSSDLDTVRRTRAALPGLPLIVLTETPDERWELQALREGAQDCLVKSQISTATLVRAIRSAIERQRLLLVTEETRQQQARLKDEFLSHVSHELRSPLTAMDQFLSLLLDNIPGTLNAEQREFLQIVARNSGELRGLIDDLLDTTRAETGKLTVEPACVNTSHLVHETLQRYSAITRERQLHLENKLSPNLPTVSADPQRVRQILSNLLDNACKFTLPGGEIVVSVDKEEKASGFLRFSVSDTGPGIPAESLPQVFDRLYQGPAVAESSRRGLGLGLHITRELVTRHGGRIWVESELGHGATFHFTLPIFSVEASIAPLIRSAVAADKKEFALVTVVLTPANGSRRGLGERFLASVGQTLTRCTLPDMDVLLPRLDGPNHSAKFFIFACANRSGARVLTQRVQEQLQSMEELKTEQAEIGVSSAVLHSPKSDPKSGTDALLHSITSQVQRRIEDQEERTHHA